MRINLSSPIGSWTNIFQEGCWSACIFSKDPLQPLVLDELQESSEKYNNEKIHNFTEQWDEYWSTGNGGFSSIPMTFDSATSFQRQIWATSLSIEEKTVTTYAELARRAHKPKAARAVGTALSHNPLVLGVPCHRVLPAHALPTFEKWVELVRPQLGVPITHQEKRFEHLNNVILSQLQSTPQNREKCAQSIVGEYRLGSYLKLVFLTHEFWV